MIPPLEVFLIEDGIYRRIGSVLTIAKALDLARANGQGVYLVQSQLTRERVKYTINDTREVTAVQFLSPEAHSQWTS